MSEVELYLLEYDKHKDEALQIAGKAATRLESKDLKLVDLIEVLGEYLNNDDASIRIKTLFFLADVLSAVPAKTLSRQQRNLLCDFVLSRIADDPETIEPSIRALIALESMGKWEDERASQVFITLVNATNPVKQFQLQKQRYAILQLVDILMAKYRKALYEAQISTPDLRAKLVMYFDGEKDPRNLMIIFSVLLVPMTEWDISTLAQDFFEIVFNYFPITFKPPPDDPYGITAQQLKDRLRNCISSTSFFAPYAFPALLDKLDSTSPNTKRDALQAISACVTGYSTRTVSLYAVTLWDAIKFEVLNVQEEQLAEQALDALSGIAAKLSESSDLSVYLKPVAKECNEHLEDAPTKQSQASGRIIEAIAKASPEASNFLIRAITPQIISLFNTSGASSKRRALVDVLHQLLRANVAIFGEWRTSDPELLQKTLSSGIAFQDFSEQVQELILGALARTSQDEVSYHILCINCLIELVKMRNLLQDQQISKILQSLIATILGEPSRENEDLRSAAEAGLLQIAHQKPQLVINEAFPIFLAELPGDASTEDSFNLRVLTAFTKLSNEKQTFETVVMRLKNRLAIAFQRPASSGFVLSLLNALLFAFLHGAYKELDLDARKSYYSSLVQWLLEKLQVNDALDKKFGERATTMNSIGRICRIILLEQDASVQLTTMHTNYVLPDPPEHNLSDGIFPDHADLVLLSTHILAAIRTDVSLTHTPDRVINSLIFLIKREDVAVDVKKAGLFQISLVINKHILESDLQNTIGAIGLNETDEATISATNVLDIRIEFAISKGLLLRNSRSATTRITNLLNHLSNPTHGSTIARGFSTLLAPDEFLTRENHCRISKLHPQKLFALACPILTTAYRTAPSTARSNYVQALAGILAYLPYSIISAELPALIPLLLQSVDPSISPTTTPTAALDPAVQTTAIDTLTAILTHDPDTLATHAHSLVARLLAASKADASPEGVRAAALACLALLPGQLRREVVVPLRERVVRDLRGALDDARRGVRRAAVKCRVAWLGLEDEE